MRLGAQTTNTYIIPSTVGGKNMMFFGLCHVVLMSFVFVIGLTERAVLARYTMVVPARLHDQCTGANSQSELVIPNWL